MVDLEAPVDLWARKEVRSVIRDRTKLYKVERPGRGDAWLREEGQVQKLRQKKALLIGSQSMQGQCLGWGILRSTSCLPQPMSSPAPLVQ